MLGGNDAGDPQGFPLTLSQLENSAVSFHGTRLLTLSACSTAKGDTANDGLEMDSLGMVAQQKDAEAVLATLWDVNDASTSRIMSDFYARWVKDPAIGKAEALRQAQLAFLHGSSASHAFRNRPRRRKLSDQSTRHPGHVVCSSLLLGALCPHRKLPIARETLSPQGCRLQVWRIECFFSAPSWSAS